MTLRSTITTAALVLAAIPMAAQTSTTAPKGEDGTVTVQPAPNSEIRVNPDAQIHVEIPDVPPVPDLPAVPNVPPVPDLPPLPPLPPLPMLIEGGDWVELDGADESDNTEEGREKLRQMREASRELRAKMRDLQREYKTRLRDVKKYRVEMAPDSAGLASMLETVRIGLDSAMFSLKALDSTIRFSSRGNTFTWSFGGDTGNCNMRWTRSIRVESDSVMSTLGPGKRKTVIISSGDGAGEVQAQALIIKNNEMADDLQVDDEDVLVDGELRSMLIVNGDTTFLPNAGRKQKVVRITTTDSGGVSSRSVIVSRTACGDSSVSSVKNIMILSGEAAKEKLKQSNPGLVTEKSNVVIISTTKGKKVKRDRKAEPAPAAEKLSTRTSSTVAGYALEQAIPNPASGTATIGFTIGRPGRATLTLFDETGKTVKMIRDEELDAGTYSDRVDVSGLPTGLYLYRLVSGGFSQTGTLSVVR